ncbi:MAG: amidohydrolase [Planctomycetia bacterium]|nr:amidohydrolase [Planctomycetia bacterium]
MIHDNLFKELHSAISEIVLIDPHTHIDPHRPASRTLDDILGYHYYTELAHSAGMTQEPLAASVPPRERVRAILAHMPRYDNTAQYAWFLDICRTFLGYDGDRVNPADADWLFDAAERLMAQPDWEQQVLTRSKLEAVFLTNEFDDRLEGFDTTRYIPCLRTDDLVFKLDQPSVRQRLAKATGIEVGDAKSVRLAVSKLFAHFAARGARACAISLPPDFSPRPVTEFDLNSDPATRASGVFWMLAEHCREFQLPFDLMIGVNRRVYRNGVYQGQDLFDSRTSLMLYAELFNAFPSVPFCVSVLSSTINQELCSFAWIFPNVITSGHWWYANVPAFIRPDLAARLQAVPKTKQLGYYSDMYKLEFGLPKFNMYRRVLAGVLADDFVRTGQLSVDRAVELARFVLRDNVRSIFRV